jgi:Terminase RNaseH-like domain
VEKEVIGDILLLRRLGGVLDRKVRRAVDGSVEECTIRDLMIEALLKVRGKGKGLVLLKPNRAQREYSRNCSKKNVVLKARQLGITTYIAARYFIQTITQPGTMTVQVAHTQESAEAIFNIVHRFWENLPKQMQKGALVRSRASSRQIVFPWLDSQYRVATAADPNAGRGMTIHNLHCSEVARWPRDAEETLASLRSAVPEDGEIVLESTPNGAGGVFYEEWQRAEEVGYVRHFFPWWYEEKYRIKNLEPQKTQRDAEEGEDSGSNELSHISKIARCGAPAHTEEEEELVRRFGLDAGQIAWRRASWARLRGMAAQEFAEDPVSCFRASGECVFELEAIERAAQLGGTPLESRENGRLVIWLPARPGKKYIIGVDPAGGGSEGDYSCAQVIERKTAMQCAELHGHYSPRELAAKVVELGNIYKDALIVVERNNHGFGVLAHLRAMGCGSVYREGEQDGWLTSAVSRPAMIESLAAVLAEAPGLFSSPRLLNECRTFVRHADGGSAAMAGAHDDCVMAMAIALAARERVAGETSRQTADLWHFRPEQLGAVETART